MCLNLYFLNVSFQPNSHNIKEVNIFEHFRVEFHE